MEQDQEEIEAILERLDQKSRNILHALSELDDRDGVSETPDITQLTNIEPAQIHYRIKEYLEPFGFVESNQPVGEGGPMPPKQIYLTEAGKEFVDYLESHSDARIFGTVGDRLDRLEDQVDGLRSELVKVQEQLADIEEPASKTAEQEPAEDDIDELQEQVGQLAMELEEVKDDRIFDEDIRGQLDAARLGAIAYREILEDEFGEDEVEARINQWQEKVTPLQK